jgi:hypothetical protein
MSDKLQFVAATRRTNVPLIERRYPTLPNRGWHNDKLKFIGQSKSGKREIETKVFIEVRQKSEFVVSFINTDRQTQVGMNK